MSSTSPDDPDLTRAADPAVGAARDIGPYRLVERLGEGGMGEVWLADQRHPVRRRVALKLIKAGMDTAQVIARFEAERQALALMDHPAIARVFDAGASDQGRPFFAMEYIRGESITSYCDRHALTIGQRLEVFLQVCEGVQHAHQRGIIHRDLKPSNILVTLQGDRPVPKIIDFGVAKATTRLTGQTLVTALGGFVGTPEYMSPEQANAGTDDIDTRTDVYALGIVLYELLTGTLPLESARLSGRNVADILHAIQTVAPPRPSTRIARSGLTAADAASRRQTQPKRLASLLSGDLDWITMCAIEKDRRRRYGSASELAADLRRHLTMLPVLASPPSATYRLGKFVQRHRAGMATAAALVLLLAAAVVVTAMQARRIAQERDRANLEAAAARQVSDFLVGLFRVSDPSEARGNSLTARDILDKGAKDAFETLQAQPELQARLLATIGTVYTGLGSYRAAEPLLEQAVATRRRVLGAADLQTLDAINALANLYWYRDRLADAEPLYNEVVTGRRRLLGAEHADTLRAEYDLASLYYAQNRPGEFERLMLRTLDTQRRVLGETNADTLLSLSNLGALYHQQRRFTEAEPLRRQVLEGMRRTMGADHPATLISMHNLATTFSELEKWQDAERQFLETIAAKTRVFGVRHEATVQTVAALAAMFVQRRDYAAAEQHLVGQDALLQPLDTADPKAMNRLARAFVSLYEAWGKPDKAASWRARIPAQ